jgi:hypothetical protein
MKDAEILATVYRWMNQSIQRGEDDSFKARRMVDCKEFIEQEWQRQDEETDKNSTIGLENMADTTYSKHWYDKPKTYKMPDGYSVDQGGALDERHRGLDIGEDGTVTNLK